MGLTQTLTPVQEKAILGVDISLLDGEIADSTIERFKNPHFVDNVDNEFDYLILLKYLNSTSGGGSSGLEKLQMLPNRLPASCNLAAWAELDKLLLSVEDTDTTTDTDTLKPLIANALALARVRTEEKEGDEKGKEIRKIVASIIGTSDLASATRLLSHYNVIVPRDLLLPRGAQLSGSSSGAGGLGGLGGLGSPHFLLLWARAVGEEKEKEKEEAQAVHRALSRRASLGGNEGNENSDDDDDPVGLLQAHVTLLKCATPRLSAAPLLPLLHDILAVVGEDPLLYTRPLATFLESVYASLRDNNNARDTPTTTTTTTNPLHWAKLAAQTGGSPLSHGQHALWAHRAGDDKTALGAAKQAVKSDPDSLAWINLYAKLLTGGTEGGASSRDRAVVVLSQVVAQLEREREESGDAQWRKHAVHSHLLLVLLTGVDAVDVLPALFAFVNRVFPQDGGDVKQKKMKRVDTKLVAKSNEVKSDTCIGGPREKLKSLLHLNRSGGNGGNGGSNNYIVRNGDNSDNGDIVDVSTTDTKTLSFMWTTLAKALYHINITSALECIDEARKYTPKLHCDYLEAALRNDQTKLSNLIRTTPTTETNQHYATALLKLHSANPTNATLSRLQKLQQNPIWSRHPGILIAIDKIAVNAWFGLFIDDIDY